MTSAISVVPAADQHAILVPATYTSAQAQKRLGVSKKTLYTYVRRGQIRRVDTGAARPRYAVADVEAILAEQAQAASGHYLSREQAMQRLGMGDYSSFYALVRQQQIRHAALFGAQAVYYVAADVERVAQARPCEPVPEDLCTGTEARALIGDITQPQFSDLVGAGKIRKVVLAGHHLPYYVRADVEALIAQGPIVRIQRGQSKHTPDQQYAEAYTAMYERLYPQALRYLQYNAHFSPEDAEDCVQHAFCNIWQDSEGFFTTYQTSEAQRHGLYFRLKQLLANYRESERVRRKYPVVPLADWMRGRVPSAEEQALQREQIRSWWRQGIAQLPEARRMLQVWKLLGLSYGEMWQRLQQQGVSWSRGMMMRYCNEDRQQVRKWLGDQQG